MVACRARRPSAKLIISSVCRECLMSGRSCRHVPNRLWLLRCGCPFSRHRVKVKPRRDDDDRLWTDNAMIDKFKAHEEQSDVQPFIVLLESTRAAIIVAYNRLHEETSAASPCKDLQMVAQHIALAIIFFCRECSAKIIPVLGGGGRGCAPPRLNLFLTRSSNVILNHTDTHTCSVPPRL